MFELIRAREDIYSVLERMPQTFCHMDAFSRNLFLRKLPGNKEQIVALDWSFSGRGAVGEELAPLVAASYIFTGVSGASMADLYGTALDGYLTGLRETGWHGSPWMVEFVFQAAAPLRYLVAIMRFALYTILQPENIPTWEAIIGQPWNVLQEQMAEQNLFLAANAKIALNQLPDYL